jgi:hypothetical protein
MTQTYPSWPPIPPIVCAPWCDKRDGHTNERCPEDQTCWGATTYLPLELEPAVSGIPARLGAMAHRLHEDAAPEVYLHADLPEWNIDVGVHLTAREARAMAEALTSAADEIDGR